MKSNKKPTKILAIGSIVAFGFMTYMYFSRVEVTAVCRDVRTYMDGTYSAAILKGGFSSKTILTLYRLDNMKNKKVASLEVNQSTDKIHDMILYSGKDISLQVNRKSQNTKYSGKLDLQLAGEKITATVGCQPST